MVRKTFCFGNESIKTKKEEELNNEQEKKVNPKEEIIIGFYSRKKLNEFFTTNKEE